MDTEARDTRDWQWRYGRSYNICTSCEFLMHVKYARCPRCSSTSLEVEQLETNTGDLLTYTIQHYLPEGFETPLPIGLVQLDNDLRVFCPLTDCDPDDVDVGMRGRLVVKRENGSSDTVHYRIKFQPMAGEDR